MPPSSLELLATELNNLVALLGAGEEPATLIFEDDATGSN
jgi:hypothetical protein